MRASAVFFTLAAVATAQSTTTVVEAATTVATSVVPVDSATAARVECLAKCDPTDNLCQAKCVDVPAPNEDQVNETIACSAKCDQGDGSAEQTEAFGQCLLKCRNEHYFSEGAGTPEATGGSGSGSGSNTGATTTASGAAATGSASSGSGSGASETNSEDSSASGTASSDANETSSTSEPNSASTVRFTSAGVLGLIAAFFL
ncbi:hypothetical protein F5X68DRAFT_20060 [Plectosphaerella plurivora]|uniref:Uncharacterized protein n=1 Tax=Plectosphaerella plurivora TaxID=936078 RepID=A0A9P8VA48_9PEZI|nr:hypothetical protein F5X68DRAFT_20060 [Plectosphaerella plurivora]